MSLSFSTPRALRGSSFARPLFAVALTLGLTATRAAGAQPDPFADYEAMKSGAPLPRVADEASVPAAVRFPLTPGTMMVGGRTAFSYTGTSNETPSGGELTNRTFLYRLTPTFSYLYQGRYLLSGSFGLMGKTLTREGGARDGETDWLLEASVHYVVPISDRVAFLPGAGLGGYLGSSTKETGGANGITLKEETSTRGLALTLYANIAYQITSTWQVRSGLALYGVSGSEKADSQPSRLGSSAVHVGLPVEVFYTFLSVGDVGLFGGIDEDARG